MIPHEDIDHIETAPNRRSKFIAWLVERGVPWSIVMLLARPLRVTIYYITTRNGTDTFDAGKVDISWE